MLRCQHPLIKSSGVLSRMSTRSAMVKRPLLLFDWDGTLTTSSTLAEIASIRPEAPESILEPYTKAYIEDYKTHTKSYQPEASQRNTLDQELAYLDSLRPIEAASIKRLEKGLIWRDVKISDIKASAQRECKKDAGFKLRDGATSLIQRAHDQAGLVCVISVSWSAEWISAVLNFHGISARPASSIEDLRPGSQRTGQEKPMVHVLANDFDENGLLSRGLPPDLKSFNCGRNSGVWTAGDKKEVMRKVVTEVARQGTEWQTIYFGDSATDLGCIADADVGICIHDENLSSEQQGLKEVVERLGWNCQPVSDFGTCDEPREDVKSKAVWWTRDFTKIWENLTSSSR